MRISNLLVATGIAAIAFAALRLSGADHFDDDSEVTPTIILKLNSGANDTTSNSELDGALTLRRLVGGMGGMLIGTPF